MRRISHRISLITQGLVLSCFIGLPAQLAANPPSPNLPAVVLENETVRWEWGTDGRTLRFLDKANGVDCLDTKVAGGSPRLRVGIEELLPASCEQQGDLIEISFGRPGYTATLKAICNRTHITLEVVKVEGEGIESLVVADVPLLPEQERPNEFSMCALALNLQTYVAEIPGPSILLHAECFRRFGIVGSKVALLACPPDDMRDLMKSVVSAADGLPHSSLGGPWALDSEAARGSYLIDSEGKLSESTLDGWIDLAGKLGIKQIDLHTGRSLRFGDYVPNPAVFPDGVASLRAITDRLHEAGILVGLHTYAFFIGKDTPWVTPVPDPRLAKDATFTLAADLVPDSTSITVIETTGLMSAVTGFQIRNSATLQIGDELIVYKNLSKVPPYQFTECTRGAHGTRVTEHRTGAKVHHLKECFGLFVPDGDSSLFVEVAEKTASLYNDAGFDMIYLDALDGSDIIAGGENAWYYGSKFVFELCSRLKRPALLEMSTMSHHLWSVRSRMGAWDCPSRGMKRFIDMHSISNEKSAESFMPTNLGWWAVFDWNGVQPERTFPDDIEYLCTKSVGFDSGISLLVGFTPESYDRSHNIRRLADIIRRYEELRLSGKVPLSVRQRLRNLGEEFTLDHEAGDSPLFRPVQYDAHKVESTDEQSGTWKFTNPFAAQPVRFRVEVLLSAEGHQSPRSTLIADFGPPEFCEKQSREGVHASLQPAEIKSPDGEVAGRFSAFNQRDSREGTWAGFGSEFYPPLNMTNRGLGLWVNGDGQGEVLSLQYKSPAFLGGGLANHYLDVDWTGWRYFNLIEPDAHRIGLFEWPYASASGSWRSRVNQLPLDAYPNLHTWVSYHQLESINLWCNNLPVGTTTTCYLGAMRSVPLKSVTLQNLTIEVGGKSMVIPIELASGSYVEFRGPSDCTVYDATGEPVQQVSPMGDFPIAAPGENEISFTCEGPPDLPHRLRVTTILVGDPLL